MKSEEWKSYRTRFLVNAKQLNSTISFVDHLGRQHHGRKGDYLVESSDGVITVAPRRIFEDIYVPMPKFYESGVGESVTTMQPPSSSRCIPQESADLKTKEPEINHKTINRQTINQQKVSSTQVEGLDIEEVKLPKPPIGRQRAQDSVVRSNRAAAVQRKLPQPCRDRRSSSNQFGFM